MPLAENLQRSDLGLHQESPFVEGFVSASLLFVIGPLAILGSVSDGMSQGIDQLDTRNHHSTSSQPWLSPQHLAGELPHPQSLWRFIRAFGQ
jgi:hypothetical protein